MFNVAIDLTGMRFNKLLVIERHGSNKHKLATWLCICDCGNKTVITSQHLRKGYNKSCGCLRTKHGLSHKLELRVYRIWSMMKTRCQNPKSTGYKYYGGRGIKVCKEWLDFENFFKDMGFPPSDQHTLDRINNNGNYEKINCKWSTRIEQANNRRPRRSNEKYTHAVSDPMRSGT